MQAGKVKGVQDEMGRKGLCVAETQATSEEQGPGGEPPARGEWEAPLPA